MVGEAGAECASLEAAAGLRRLEDLEGRSSPSGMDPSVRMSVRSDCSEQFCRRGGSGGTMGVGFSGVPVGEGLVGKGALGPYR